MSAQVYNKVEEKGTTSLHGVSDEIIREYFQNHENDAKKTPHTEKNIRRRIYDAFNVMMALDIIVPGVKHKKELIWNGLTGLPPSKSQTEIEKLQVSQ